MEATRELAPETWTEYFDALSRDVLYAPVSVQVTGAAGPPLIEASHLALLALTYDRRDDVLEVTVARGGPQLPSVLRHLVDHPARIQVDSPPMLAPTTITVDGSDEVRTVITIAPEPEITS